jgi:hypothetical protein
MEATGSGDCAGDESGVERGVIARVAVDQFAMAGDFPAAADGR